MGSGPVVAVCSGSDCAKDQRDAHRRLMRELRDGDGFEVVTTKCLKLCHGPVAVVDVRGTPVVVEKVRKSERRRQVIVAAQGGKRGPLADYAVKGKKAQKAVERARAAAKH